MATRRGKGAAGQPQLNKIGGQGKQRKRESVNKIDSRRRLSFLTVN